MKRIDAIIRPEKLEDVKRVWPAPACRASPLPRSEASAGRRATASITEGPSTGGLPAEGAHDVIVSEDRLADILNAIVESARTGKMGDGKIFVTALEEVSASARGTRTECHLMLHVDMTVIHELAGKAA